MESIQTHLYDEDFDRLVHNADYQECGDLQMAIKQQATAEKKPGVVIAFTINVDGKPKKVQAVTTLACLEMTMAALKGSTMREF